MAADYHLGWKQPGLCCKVLASNLMTLLPTIMPRLVLLMELVTASLYQGPSMEQHASPYMILGTIIMSVVRPDLFSGVNPNLIQPVCSCIREMELVIGP